MKPDAGDDLFLVRLLSIVEASVGNLQEQQAAQIALRIAEEFGGDRPYINRPATVQKWLRDRAVADYVREGHSVIQAAQKFGMRRQSIYRLPTMKRRR